MKPTGNPERWGGVQANKLPIRGCGHFLEQHNREVSEVQSCSLEEFRL